MSEKISVFLPCRKGSERVPKKNIRPFSVYASGLLELKLGQLLGCSLIDEVVLSTNDEEILCYARTLTDSRLRVQERANELSSSQTSTDQLVGLALELIPEGHIVWTHVTSPFITSVTYESIIERYWLSLEQGHDSLMTTTLLHNFLWQDGKPINYDRSIEKWPRTQTLKPIHEINSGAFVASTAIYRTLRDRVGENPYLYVLDKLVSQDIDWPEDFVVAETLAEKGLVSL